MPDDFLRRLLGANRSLPVIDPQTIKLLQSIFAGQQPEQDQQGYRLPRGPQTSATNLAPAPLANPFADLAPPQQHKLSVAGDANAYAHEGLHSDGQSGFDFTDLLPDERQQMLDQAKRDTFDFSDFLSGRNQGDLPHLYTSTDANDEAEQAFRRMIGYWDSLPDESSTPVALPPEPFVKNQTRGNRKNARRFPNGSQTKQEQPMPGEEVIKLSTTQRADRRVITPESMADRVLAPQNKMTAQGAKLARENARLLNEAAAKGQSVSSSIQVEGKETIEDLMNMIERDIVRRAGITDEELQGYLAESNSPRILKDLGDPQQAKRGLAESSKYNGQFFYQVPAWLIANLKGYAEKSRLAKMTPEQKLALAAAIAHERPLSDEEKAKYGVEMKIPLTPSLSVNLGYPVTAAAHSVNTIGENISGIGRMLESLPQGIPMPNQEFSTLHDIGALMKSLGDESQQKAQFISNLYKPEGVGGAVAAGIGAVAPELAVSLMLPEIKGGQLIKAGISPTMAKALESVGTHMPYWMTTAGTKSLGRGESPAEAARYAALAGAMLYADRPLSPLMGAVKDSLLESGVKLGSRALLGGMGGYAQARVEGANHEEAIASAIQTAAMLANGGKVRIEEPFSISRGIRARVQSGSEINPITKGETETHYGGKFRIEKFKKLSPEERAVERRAVEQFERDPEKFISDYIAKNTKDGVLTVNTDEARSLFPEYQASHESRATFATAVHRPSGAIATEIWKRAIKDPQYGDNVLFSAGGGGSGKSYTLSALPEIAKNAKLINDTTFSHFESSDAKIKDLLEIGKKVYVLMVYTPAEIAAAKAYGRAVEGFNETHKQTGGRTVPEEALIYDHYNAPLTVIRLAEKYRDNPLVQFFYVENDGASPPKELSLDQLNQRIQNRTKESVANEISRGIENEHGRRISAGEDVPNYVYKAFKGVDPRGKYERNR